MAKEKEPKEDSKAEAKPDPRYPKFKYHETKGSELVYSFDEEKALGDGWKESPAAFGVVTAPSREDQRRAKGQA